jgi:HAD superfamily hydrolase (TIGR01509 family)
MARPVIFDMDGVLVDSEPIYAAGFRDCVAALGHPELGRWFPNTLGRRVEDFLPELAAELDRPAALVADRLRESVAVALALDSAELEPMPFAREAVEALGSDRPIGLASSSARPLVDRVLGRLGLERSFAAIATGEEVARGKPEPEIYDLVAERLGVPAQACVAIEDTPAGVTAASTAGMTAVAVPNALTAGLDFSGAHAVVADLAAAAALIRRLDGG